MGKGEKFKRRLVIIEANMVRTMDRLDRVAKGGNSTILRDLVTDGDRALSDQLTELKQSVSAAIGRASDALGTAIKKIEALETERRTTAEAIRQITEFQISQEERIDKFSEWMRAGLREAVLQIQNSSDGGFVPTMTALNRIDALEKREVTVSVPDIDGILTRLDQVERFIERDIAWVTAVNRDRTEMKQQIHEADLAALNMRSKVNDLVEYTGIERPKVTIGGGGGFPPIRGGGYGGQGGRTPESGTILITGAGQGAGGSIPQVVPRHMATRRSDVEEYIRRWRDGFDPTALGGTGHHDWQLFDDLLDDYRERADLGHGLGRFEGSDPVGGIRRCDKCGVDNPDPATCAVMDCPHDPGASVTAVVTPRPGDPDISEQSIEPRSSDEGALHE